jgi:hypothetical protein
VRNAIQLNCFFNSILKLKTRLFSGKISVFKDEVLNDTIGDEVLGWFV